MLECVLRRSLEHDHATRPGRHPEQHHQLTDTPTAERLLQAVSDVSLTILKTAAGEDIVPRLTPVSALPQDILQRLGLDTSLDQQLAMHETGN